MHKVSNCNRIGGPGSRTEAAMCGKAMQE